MRLRVTTTFVAGLALAIAPAAAATRAPDTPPAPVPAPAPAAPARVAPPYQTQILRLAELLGVLAYMTDLCSLPDAGAWRTRMNALLGTEGQAAATRDLLAGAFNRGFRSYEATYRVCTPNAQLVITRSLDEAGRLSGTIVRLFGPS